MGAIDFVGKGIKRLYTFFDNMFTTAFRELSKYPSKLLAAAATLYVISSVFSSITVGPLSYLSDVNSSKKNKRSFIACMWQGLTLPTKIFINIFDKDKSKSSLLSSETQPVFTSTEAKTLPESSRGAARFSALVPERRDFERTAFKPRNTTFTKRPVVPRARSHLRA